MVFRTLDLLEENWTTFELSASELVQAWAQWLAPLQFEEQRERFSRPLATYLRHLCFNPGNVLVARYFLERQFGT